MWNDLVKGYINDYIPPEKHENKNNLTPFDFTNMEKSYGRYKVDIIVRHNKDKELVDIEIIDNGIGITKQDIKEKMLQIGSSWHGYSYQKKIKNIPHWLRPSGSFGIGLHSAFAVTEHFQIETRSQEENHGNRIILHSGKGHGFVFSRPDADIKKHGTRIVLEAIERSFFPITNGWHDFDDLDNSHLYDLEYDLIEDFEEWNDNPILMAIRNYISENILCSLFDINLIDGNIGKKIFTIPGLHKHVIYGRLFDPVSRNHLVGNTYISDKYLKNGYYVALTYHSPLCFVLWDRSLHAMYEFGMAELQIADSEDDPPNSFQEVTYMGIALRGQNVYSLNNNWHGGSFGLYVQRAEFMSGEGKRDITADRYRLKRDRVNDLRLYLQQMLSVAAQFGQELLASVLKTSEVKHLMKKASQTAESLLGSIGNTLDIHSNLECIFHDSKLTLAGNNKYMHLIFHYFFQKNIDSIQNHINRIVNANESLSINNRRAELCGIEDLSLKDLRLRGNKSPAPPVEPPQRGAVLTAQGLRP